jgi:hypothetical protein
MIGMSVPGGEGELTAQAIRYVCFCARLALWSSLAINNPYTCLFASEMGFGDVQLMSDPELCEAVATGKVSFQKTVHAKQSSVLANKRMISAPTILRSADSFLSKMLRQSLPL